MTLQVAFLFHFKFNEICLCNAKQSSYNGREVNFPKRPLCQTCLRKQALWWLEIWLRISVQQSQTGGRESTDKIRTQLYYIKHDPTLDTLTLNSGLRGGVSFCTLHAECDQIQRENEAVITAYKQHTETMAHHYGVH